MILYNHMHAYEKTKKDFIILIGDHCKNHPTAETMHG